MRKGSCKHYGCLPGGKTVCAKGLDIRKHVGGPDYGWMRRMPCVSSESMPSIDEVPCPLYEDPTEEEIAEHEAKMTKMLDALDEGTCGECGATLLRVGSGFACPEGHISGLMCGEKDIRDNDHD